VGHRTSLKRQDPQLRIDRLANDPAFVESVARRELGMVRPDELIFKFAPSAGDP
jgi:cell division protein FtsB